MDLLARFRQLPTGARTAIAAIGGLVAVYVLARGRSRGEAPETPPADIGTAPTVGTGPLGFDTDVIGSGEIMSILGDQAKELAGLTEALANWDKPQGKAPTVPHTVNETYVLAGETPNAIASRLRKAGAKTASGQPITAGYLIHFNRIKVSPTTRLYPGMRIAY